MITQERLKELLHYDPDTGVWTRKVTLCNRAVAGSIVGWNSHGYVSITVDGKKYSAHRLAWLYMTGEWPELDLDHKNTVRTDNRWSNLRLATKSQNQSNKTKRKDNTSGYKGVTWMHKRNKWRAEIKVKPKKLHLGYFEQIEDAAAAYKNAATKYFGEYARYD